MRLNLPEFASRVKTSWQSLGGPGVGNTHIFIPFGPLMLSHIGPVSDLLRPEMRE